MATIGPFDFSKGFSPGYSFNVMPPGYASEMRNCRVKNGSIVPRWSQEKTTAATLGATRYVTGLTAWIDSANAVTALVATCNGKIYTADTTGYFPSSSALTFTDRTGAVTIHANNSPAYTFDSLNGILVVAGNSAAGVAPIKMTAYNANAAALGGTPPKADCVKVVNNFAFLGRQLNSSTTYSTLNWSNVSDPETWGAANSIEINKKDGEAIMALGAIGSDLYIFKQSSIWRLSTITTITSGGVTLGPLQQVVKGIGCSGPLALDNLPNGDIVFLGFDGHFYEFDGSSVYDLSRQPYPGPNVYDSFESATIGGLGTAVAGVQTCVKTWRGIGEVWISFDSNITGSGNLFNVFAYDYVNRIWQGYVTDTYPKCFATIPISPTVAAAFESNDMLFHGNATGDIFVRGRKGRPVDETGVATEVRFQTTIRMANEASSFVPRSVGFETDLTSSVISLFATYVAFDTYSLVSSLASPAGPLPMRTILPIPMRQDTVGSNILPALITLGWTVQFTASASSAECLRFGKFFLSDEIAR